MAYVIQHLPVGPTMEYPSDSHASDRWVIRSPASSRSRPERWNLIIRVAKLICVNDVHSAMPSSSPSVRDRVEAVVRQNQGKIGLSPGVAVALFLSILPGCTSPPDAPSSPLHSALVGAGAGAAAGALAGAGVGAVVGAGVGAVIGGVVGPNASRPIPTAATANPVRPL